MDVRQLLQLSSVVTGEINATVPVVERTKLRLCYNSDGEAQEHVLYLARPKVPLPDEENFTCMVRGEYGGGVYQPWALGWPVCW